MKTFLLITLFPVAALAQDYCALTVRVLNPAGTDEPRGVVSMVEEQSGRTEAVQRGAVARFCDLGMTPVTITVGGPGCNQVVVHNVRLSWQRETVLKVTYDLGPCLEEMIPIAACQLLYRFSDPDGKWISGVSLRPQAQRATSVSDAYGRLMVQVGAGDKIIASATREGYLPEALHQTCTRDLLYYEQIIVLHPSTGNAR